MGSTSASTGGGSSSSGGPVVTGTGGTSGGPEPTSTVTLSSGEVVSTSDVMATTGTTVTAGTTATTGGAEGSTGGTSGGIPELPVPGCTPLFYTDFSEDPASVLNLSGSWAWNQKSGTVTAGTDKGQSTFASTMESWADATAYTRVRVTAGFATLRLRTSEALPGFSYYYATMHPAQDLQLGRVVGGQVAGLDNTPFAVDVQAWYTLSLRVHGTGLQAAVDGQAMLMAQDDQLMSGTASIGGYGVGLAEFDWFLVCAN
ncbi:hypothetical protein [Nannocystis sp.]|uniref:hypothetical protein n=1 Tax=Nannocystis sp. TaxID=1962667 RepID=UPI0025DF33F8|nr:hypothetical protein [Nannocystis sp.]MBK7825913.1 hypothetical protein [Nannocystis sp.]